MKLFLLALIALSASAQTGTVDYVFGTKNKDALDARQYAFTRTKGTAASASPTLDSPGAGKAITMNPCPLGVTSFATTHHNFRIYNAGTAETVMTTGFSQSGANCTVTVTTANAHVGTWIIGSNSGGIQEALVDASYLRRAVHLVGADWDIYGTVVVPDNATIYGDGQVTAVRAQAPSNYVMFDAPGNHHRFSDFFLTTPGIRGPPGLIGIRLGQGAQSSFTWITRMFFDYLWQDVTSINAAHLKITDSLFYNYVDVAIVAQDTLNPDYAGLMIMNCTFLNWDLAANARASILINSTSSALIANNVTTDQVNWCIWNQATGGSGGWINITGNKCEGTGSGAFYIDGNWPQSAIVGNTLSNYSNNGWIGIRLNGIAPQGMWEGTISGNVFQGNGPGATNTNAIYFTGYYSYWSITGNLINGFNIGMNFNAGTSAGIQVGSNSFTNVGTTPMYLAQAGILVDGVNISYGLMQSTSLGTGNAAAGSRVYCTDCNSTCTGGGGAGRTCFKEGSAWTH